MAVKFVALSKTAILPKRATKASAVYDLHADQSAVILPGGWKLIKTGVTLEMPSSLEGQVRSRSGNALKAGVFVLNSPGTVDADYYPNEIGVIIANFGTNDFFINQGDRIAQLVISSYITTDDDLTSEYNERVAGFGHTGK